METKPACRSLVLDAGPLLSLSPLRGLAEHYLTVPQVLSELKDKNAREHFERLGLSAGVKIELREPDAASLSQVIQAAKKTGDYSVLSHADMCVIALTLALDRQDKEIQAKESAEEPSSGSTALEATETVSTHNNLENGGFDEPSTGSEPSTKDSSSSAAPVENEDVVPSIVQDESGEAPPLPASEEEDVGDNAEREPLDVVLEPIKSTPDSLQPEHGNSEDTTLSRSQPSQNSPLYDNPSDEDDGEGEWITPDNVDLHKSRALDLFPSTDSSDPFITVSGKKSKGKRRQAEQSSGNNTGGGPKQQIGVGCMTADFAMQNVLLQMNLNLVGVEGKRIEKVKSWVLRCHACFKICKDSSKKFCPSCGNPSLLRTSVTAKAPNSDDSSPALEVHLKKNFVYRTRGTIYPIPASKPGSSKKGSGEGLILREDQSEYMRAQKREEGRRQREEKKIMHQTLAAAKGGEVTGIKLGNWMDPDWVPEMLSVGIGGKGRKVPDGRTPLGADGMPIIGYGKKNPNERRRKR
ncbi:uncharacterized protein FOMMEDRAFT_111028 [Fomitiporia mediterranea MF3/22]|uniref:uncharacterized protein n=1 Tax=Fomitiporia mediterranea (strain MF3/22) TaxID=694068 RepID=UPI0004409A95|nr:uncharacterized protein FOMMEDRAFT_111028 [Fomitiporia mediterranea MF3/22]EJD01310.1 hypothetical protein FOMMEDRAFT_111028 [Fomitiporia mediterranea MF3/22]